MRIAVIGGGPGGLYFAALARQLASADEITVWERNAADDTFGFGVVFSDETLAGIAQADPEIYRRMAAEFARWDDIDVCHDGQVITSGGHGFAALSRKRLLRIIRERCDQLGVTVRQRHEAPDVDQLAASHDLVVAADGANSAVRARHAASFRPQTRAHACKHMWLGLDQAIEAFTFHILRTPFGVMQAHAYPYDAHGSTFIVEMREQVWRRAGFEEFANQSFAAAESDQRSIDRVAELFASALEGRSPRGNKSRWANFTTVHSACWRHRNIVLLGDAAHTAHFSIGSGTKLAMEDALALAACLREHTTLDQALAAYEAERAPVVASIQRAAQASLEWFEDIAQYVDQPPEQFAFNLMTRSRRVGYDNLRLRDPEFVARVTATAAAERPPHPGDAADTPPMFRPFRLGELELANRVVLSPMDTYRASGGMPNDFHLVHLGGKALGGAGLVMTEMVCVSPAGRITPGCAGIWTDEHAAGWRRITDFVHQESQAKIGVQIGHSGRKGSTRLMWEGMDEPLPDGNWEVVGPSPLPYRPGVSQTPRELDQADLTRIQDKFVAAARRAEDAGFDLLELHCAHGYLLSSFISPLANQRADQYGGSLANRLRFPLAVFGAMRAVWPGHKPMTVRVSATDWADGGVTGDEAVEIARAFAAAGAAAIDVSTGQVTSAEQPAYGRSYQTPFADRIRNQVGIPTIAVGAISSYDDVNSIILAGRADLCALGRTHLHDPSWTLHAAAAQDYAGPGAPWPLPWQAGRRAPRTGRTDDARPRSPLPSEPVGARHARWRPLSAPADAVDAADPASGTSPVFRPAARW